MERNSSDEVMKETGGAQFIMGLATGAILVWFQYRWLSLRDKKTSRKPRRPPSFDDFPPFIKKLRVDKALYRVSLREWEDLEWREANGWVGRDLCHNPDGRAVRLLDPYYWNPEKQELIGIVWFGPDAESHRGLCHGGSFTSVLDDFAGHIAFFAGSSPWHGATVSVNVQLKKPIKIGSILVVKGTVESVGKKRKVRATLETIDDAGDSVEYASLDGLSIAGVRLASDDRHKDDGISRRKWETITDKNGFTTLRDTGWNE